VTVLCVVPPVVIDLANSPLVSQYDLSSLRLVTSGAAPLSRAAESRFKQVVNIGNVSQGVVIIYASLYRDRKSQHKSYYNK